MIGFQIIKKPIRQRWHVNWHGIGVSMPVCCQHYNTLRSVQHILLYSLKLLPKKTKFASAKQNWHFGAKRADAKKRSYFLGPTSIDRLRLKQTNYKIFQANFTLYRHYPRQPWLQFKIEQKYKVHFKHKTRNVNKL